MQKIRKENMKRKHDTIASIRIPLSELGDYAPDPKMNAFLNFIGSFDHGTNLPVVTNIRLSVKAVDGSWFKGPIKKKDFNDFNDLMLLFCKRMDNKKCRLKIPLLKLVNFKKSQQKSQLRKLKNKGEEKN